MKQQATQITIDEIATGDVCATIDDVIAALPKDGRGNVADGDELLCDVCKTARAVIVGAWGKNTADGARRRSEKETKMKTILIIAAFSALAIGAGVAFFFIGKHAGATDFKRYVRKNPKPIGEEEYFGITKEIDRRIGILQKWISARQGTKADVSAACLELMKLFDIRQYLALSEIRDRAAARLYAKDFLQKRTDEIYDLYAELYGSDVARRTVANTNRRTPASEPSAGVTSSETSGAADPNQTTSATVAPAEPAPAQTDGTAAQPAPVQPTPAPTETTTAAPNAPNGGK